MGNSFYSYLVFILQNSNADIEVLKTNLENFYSRKNGDSKPIVTLSGNEIILTFNDKYNFYINLSEEKYLVEEGFEFAEEQEFDWNNNPIDKEKLKDCKRRFEIWGDDDFDMVYFNDSLFILSQVELFSNIIIFEFD